MAAVGGFLFALTDNTPFVGATLESNPYERIRSDRMAPLRLFRDGEAPRSAEPQLYGRLPEFALADPRLTAADVRILGALTFLGRITFPRVQATKAKIAEQAGQAPRTVWDSLGRLKRHGYVRSERDYSVRGKPVVIILTFEYRAPFALTSEPSSKKKRACTQRRPAHCTQRRPAHCTQRRPAESTMYESFEEREKEARESPPAAITA